MEKKINVLGTEYIIFQQSEDSRLVDCDAFCDKTTKEIHVGKFPDDCSLGKPDVYEKKILRHEIVHQEQVQAESLITMQVLSCAM